MNRASSAMLVTPAATVTHRPSLGFSAAIRKLWNTFCSIYAVLKASTMRPYSTQSGSISASAPRKTEIGSIKITPSVEMMTPQMRVAAIIMVKY